MKSCLIKLNYFCNNNCIFCHERKDGLEFSLKDLKSLIKELKKENILKIYLSGGEPTLHSEFENILKNFHKNNFVLAIITNGVMLGESSFFKKISPYVQEYHITLLSHKKEIHDNLTKNKGSFKNLLNGINNIPNKEAIVINCVISKKNQGDLLSIADFVNSKGIKNIKFSLVQKKGQANKDWNNLYPDVSILLKEFSKIKNIPGVFFEGFPLCLINYDSGREIFVKNQVDLIYSPNTEKIICSEIKVNEKKKPLYCKSFCKFYPGCEGYLKEYHQDFFKLIKTMRR